MPRNAATALTAAILLAVATAPAGDWPHWRGPNLNGSTDETNLPASFSKTENIAWVVRTPGISGSTPIVLGERIYMTSPTYINDNLLAMCLSTRDGKTLWSKALGRGKAPPRGEMAASSPVSDGKTVYFTFGSGDLAALDLDGKVLWSRNLVKEFGCLAIKFGYGASPLLHKGKLYLPLLRRRRPYSYSPGAELPRTGPLKSYVLCFNARDGKTVWAQPRASDATDESRENYATPMAIDAGGRTEIIIPGGEFVTAHDAETGKELWRWEYTKERRIWQRIVVSPVIAGGLIYICQAQCQGLYALRPGGKGTIPHANYAWKYSGPAPDVCTSLLYRGSLYVLAGDSKIVSCLDPKTGKSKWRERIGGAGPYRASPTGADGKVYCISEGGDVVIFSARDDKYEELFRMSLKARPCRSTIVAAHGSLYLRLSKNLVCVRKMGAAAKTP